MNFTPVVRGAFTKPIEAADDEPAVEINTVGGNSEVTQTLYCAYEDVNTAVHEIMGFVEMSGEPFTGTSITFRTPAVYPYRPNFAATRVEVTGVGNRAPLSGAPNTANHVKARLDVTYSSLPYSVITAPGTGEPTLGDLDWISLMQTEELEPVTEFLSRPQSQLSWNSAGTMPLGGESTGGIQMNDLMWVVTIHRLPELPGMYLEYVNSVNSTPVYSRKFNGTFPKGTLLFKAPVITSEVDRNGNWNWTIEQTFHAKAIGFEDSWQKAYHSGSNTLHYVYAGGETFYQYAYREHNNLLIA